LRSHAPIYKIGAFLCRPRRSLKWCGMSVLPRRALFGYACAKRKPMRCGALAASAQERQHRHACCYINAALKVGLGLQSVLAAECGGHLNELNLVSTFLKWSLELVARQPDRIFNPLLICLSHPALI
jgi:hypothetical protein